MLSESFSESQLTKHRLTEKGSNLLIFPGGCRLVALFLKLFLCGIYLSGIGLKSMLKNHEFFNFEIIEFKIT